MEPNGQWDPKDFLTYEPQYLTIKRKIEQYKMRDEELVALLEAKVKEEVEKIINQGEKVE